MMMNRFPIAIMLLAGCALSDEELELAEVESEASVYHWSDDIAINGQNTMYQVGLASRLGSVHMVYNSGSGYLRSSRFDGASWTSATPIVGRADYGPALTNWNGQLVMVYKQQGQNRLMMSTSSTGTSWSTPVTAGSSIGSNTIRYAPAVVEHQDRLYVGYCARDNEGEDRVRIDRFDGTTWRHVVSYDAQLRCKSVALAVHPDGVFDIVFNAESGYTGTWFVFEIAGVGTPSSSWQRKALPMRSKKPMSMVTCDGITHLVHGGNSDPLDIYWTVREDGEWLGDARIAGQASEGGASLGCRGGTQTIMAHNGGYSNLWWAQYDEP